MRYTYNLRLLAFAMGSASLFACSDTPAAPASACGVPPVTTSYDFTDDVPPSREPPGGLRTREVPQFVGLGWDDNSSDEGMAWALAMAANRKNADGTPLRMTFYLTTKFIGSGAVSEPKALKSVWRSAMLAGHDMALHSVTHATDKTADTARWTAEVTGTIDALTKAYDPDEAPGDTSLASGPGIPRERLVGWRTPLLETNDLFIPVLKEHRAWYDSSLEEGFQPEQDGTNFLWPYTLDGGSPGDAYLASRGVPEKSPITKHAGFWELPVYTVIAPPEIRHALKERVPWLDVSSGKITGFDYNLLSMYSMSKAEFLSTLKHTLDLRLEGNRAPFLLGLHSDYYAPSYDSQAPNMTNAERRAAIEEFVDYALGKSEVRVRSYAQIADWMRHPIQLKCD